MAKKKGKKKPRRRNNPAPKKTYKRVRAAGSRLFGGLNIRSALADQIPMQLGAFTAKFIAKRFGGPVASETDPATWDAMTYAKGYLTSVLAGAVGHQFKRGMGQKMMLGGVTVFTNKLIQNELVNRSEWARQQFGAEDEYDDEDEYMYVDMDGSPGLYQGGEAYPLDESHRMAAGSELGSGSLVPAGDMGDDLEPVTALGYYDEDEDEMDEMGQDPDYAAYARDYR